MKKKGEIFLIIVIMLGLVVFPLSRADSGWDGSYGGGSSSGGSHYGGSSGSYGGGSGSSGGTHYHNSYHSSSSDSTVDLITGGAIFIAVVVGCIVVLIYKFLLKANSLVADISYRKIVAGGKLEIMAAPYSIEMIKKVLPDFSKEEFGKCVFEIYKNIQMAWQNFDFEALRKYTTDELFNLYNSQLEVLRLKKQKNIMKDFSMIDFEVVGMEHNGDNLVLIVQMIVKCFDYVVDEKGVVVRGNSNYQVMYCYEMAFKRGLSDKLNRCPNCNALLDRQNSNVCLYCDSVVIGANHDWVLAKKRVIAQESKIPV